MKIEARLSNDVLVKALAAYETKTEARLRYDLLLEASMVYKLKSRLD